MSELSLIHRTIAPRTAPKPGEKPPMLLLLHGVGSNEADLPGLAPYFDERFFVVSARAPLVHDSGFGWYPVQFTPNGAIPDESFAQTSRVTLETFIAEAVVAYDLDETRVYLVGFSQGAIMSLYLSLHSPELIAGAAAMSGRLINVTLAERADDPRLAGLPILAVHGLYDNVLTIADGRRIQSELSRLPLDFSYHEYPIGHHTSPESIAQVATFLTDCLNTPRRK
ncbi:MAG: dienelactone hydrolase family protein [Armatimonadetes bacterium]|nr:dienelactone hydrolase family protein [Armatimonadota bacterium]